MEGSSDKDLELACEDLRKIEKDITFEVAESYQSRRMEDSADALLALSSLIEVVNQLCKD